jgi:small subunit ribosomal protein S17
MTTESTADSKERGNRKVKKGLVVSNKMQKTVVVRVERTIRHPQYGKVVSRAKKYYAHNDGEPLAVGAEVTIRETRPLSKLKRWLVVA